MSADSSNPSCRCGELAVRYYTKYIYKKVHNYVHMWKVSVMKYWLTHRQLDLSNKVSSLDNL